VNVASPTADEDRAGKTLVVLVLNSSPTWQAKLAAALALCDGIECRFQAEPTPDLECQSPNIVLVDLPAGKFPRPDTELLLRRAVGAYPDAVTLLLSDSPCGFAKDLMKRLPLSGCMISSQTTESVGACLKLAHEGVAVLPRSLLDQLRRARSPTPLPMRRQSRSRSPEPFTGRQSEVARLLMDGMSNKGIAHRLGITESTVKNHVRIIMARMGVISRTQVVLGLLEGR